MLVGERKIKAAELLKISEYIDSQPPVGISPPQGSPVAPIRAYVAGGVWRETGAGTVQDHNHVMVPTIPHPKLAHLEQYACRVEGKDFNKRIPPGAYVVCVPFKSIRQRLTHGDIVHVERRRGALYENTLREVRITKRRIELWPNSDDSSFQTPLIYPAESSSETTEIVGVLVAVVHIVLP